MYTRLHHAPDVAIHRIQVRTVDRRHVETDELGCITAQKLDCVIVSVRALSCWKTNTLVMAQIAGISYTSQQYCTLTLAQVQLISCR